MEGLELDISTKPQPGPSRRATATEDQLRSGPYLVLEKVAKCHPQTAADP